MNAHLAVAVRARFFSWALAAGLAWLLAGCASPRIDWAPRVGNFTLDQAVLELGPPDKQFRLQDNGVVAEWLTRRGYAYSSPTIAFAPYPYYYGGLYTTYSESYSPEYFLRLTFGPDGQLRAWKRFTR